MSLNIKNPRVHALAREAAARTGRTQTSAIEQALEIYLKQLDSETDRAAKADALVRSMRKRLNTDKYPLSTDDLYDSDGLPV